jgi:hypothetical protein
VSSARARSHQARNELTARIDDLIKKIANVPALTEKGLFMKGDAILACGQITHAHKIWALVVCGQGLLEDIHSVLGLPENSNRSTLPEIRA